MYYACTVKDKLTRLNHNKTQTVIYRLQPTNKDHDPILLGFTSDMEISPFSMHDIVEVKVTASPA